MKGKHMIARKDMFILMFTITILFYGDSKDIKSQVESEANQASDEKPLNHKRLVAWWKLDESDGNDVTDSSGNAFGGKLVGNPQWRPAGGKVGGALEFDGDGDFVEISNESAFDIAGPITIAAWFKVNTFDNRWQSLISKGDTSWRLQRYAEDDALSFHCTGIASVTSQRPQGIDGRKNVNDGQWHHAVGVYDGSEVLLYIDGGLDNSSKAFGEIQMNDFAVIIGGNSEHSGRDWNGLIDEVHIIAGAIDANAVHALYTGTDPIVIAQTANPRLQNSDKLIAWWKFENDANDSAGSNNGTIRGNPGYVDGKFGRAISLDGDDYVDCGNSSVLNFGTGDWAVSAWMKTTQTGTDDENKGTIFANGGDEVEGKRYTMAVNEVSGGVMTLTTDDDVHEKVRTTGETRVNDGAWHHVVGMRNANQLHVYIDGVLDGRSVLYDDYDLSGVSQHNAYIGAITNNSDNSLYKHFVGQIDEVCVFACALDVNSVRALYWGKHPSIMAEQAQVLSEPQAQSQQVYDVNIVGDWEATIVKLGLNGVIKIWKADDDSLAATLTFGETTVPFNEVTFSNGRLRLEASLYQSIVEGTAKEDGMTIEGEWQQVGQQIMSIMLKRIGQVGTNVGNQNDIEVSPGPPGQPMDSPSGGRSNLVTTLVLVFVLVGVIGAIILFVVKSSVRK